ncbi:MAG: hypothetical protein HXX15_05910 [Rhodopseudomonas sp.]|uniref:hypothetical protein n=1 Tax=Rhodopseudomonas sp. TaxID=1078 RepID=UPI001824BC19|nr:hypothetical protein [Rhodopseudomonas sp.]NVN85608.1 hypothetical protein [Rhodopseudomonas sp.]
MNHPQLLPESPDERDTARFLRRFSELISVGQSASYLRHAAGLIDELVGRLKQTEELLQDEQMIGAEHIARRRMAEAELQTVKLEIGKLQALRAEDAMKLKSAAESLAAERRFLTERYQRAEAELVEVSDELQQMQAKFASVGDTHTVVPVSTLLSLRAQFESLAKEFRKSGDTVSDVMCEIGVSTVDQALAGQGD